MKQTMFKFVAALGLMLMAVGCGKENILWLDPCQEYVVTNIRVRNSNGGWDEVLGNIFPSASRIAFRKEGLCDHNIGYLDVTNKVFDTSYHPPGGVYNSSTGLWTYGCGQYTLVWSSAWVTSQTFRHNFDWHKRSQKVIGLSFAGYDEVASGSSAVSVAWLLSRDYEVYEDSKDPAQSAFAGVVVLKNPDVEIVLKR